MSVSNVVGCKRQHLWTDETRHGKDSSTPRPINVQRQKTNSVTKFTMLQTKAKTNWSKMSY